MKSLTDIQNEIREAFRKDCQKLLLDYEKLQTLKFEPFAKIWRDMQFSMVYCGYRVAAELKAFIEICFATVKKFLIHQKSVYTQVGALYLLYGLYYKQPLECWLKIRITIEELISLEELMQQIKLIGEQDPLYVYAKLRFNSAFTYVASETPLTLEDKVTKISAETENKPIFGSDQKPIAELLGDILFENNDLKELEDINEEYLGEMKKFSEENPSDVLTVFESNIAKDLEDKYREIQQQLSSVQTDGDDPSQTKVKQKAFRKTDETYRDKKLKAYKARTSTITKNDSV